MVFIYTLSSTEEPNNIRYIGKTNNIKDRIRRHISKYYLNLEDNYKNRWIKSELAKGNSILIEKLDYTADENWEDLERYWIAQFRNWGFRLVNTTYGGDGIRLTNELIQKRNESNKNSEKRKLAYENMKYPKLEEDIIKYSIVESNGIWKGVRSCPACNKVIVYESVKRTSLLSNIRIADRFDRECFSCMNSGDRNYFYGKKLNDGKAKQERYGKKILQLDLDGNILNEYNSIREASEKTGVDRKSISRCARGIKNYNTAKGYKFKIKQ